MTLTVRRSLHRFNAGTLFRISCIALLHASAANVAAVASMLSPGNVVASVNHFTGHIDPPRFVAEYQPSGQYVQTLASRPSTQFDQELRDLVVGNDNAIYAIYGTFSPELARLDISTLTWSTRTFAGWSLQGNTTVGGIASFDHFVFVGDMGSQFGIARFDNYGGPTVRFPAAKAPVDVTLGRDGILYALTNANTILRFDPTSMNDLGTMSLSPPPMGGTYRGAVGDVDGSVFIVDSRGVIQHLSSTGTLISSLNTSFNLIDIDLSADGRIWMGTTNYGAIVMTDTALSPVTSFLASLPFPDGGQVFVAFVPEPDTFSLFAISCCLIAPSLLKRTLRRY